MFMCGSSLVDPPRASTRSAFTALSTMSSTGSPPAVAIAARRLNCKAIWPGSSAGTTIGGRIRAVDCARTTPAPVFTNAANRSQAA